MAVNFHISKDGNQVTIRHLKDSFDLQTPDPDKFLHVPRYQEDFNTQSYHLTASNPSGNNVQIVGPDGRVIINAVPYTALKTGTSNSAIGVSVGATVTALNGTSFFAGSSVDADISANSAAHTTNASNITSLQTTVTSEQAKVLALQNTIKSLSGDRGIYITNSKDENSSKVKLTTTSARLQAGSKTSIDIDESSPGTLTFAVAAGSSGSEVETTAYTITGTTAGRTTHTFIGDTFQLTSNSSATGGRIILKEGTANGTNSLTLAAPSAITASTILTFPDGAGTNGQVLSTNGSGTLSWVDNTGLSAIHAGASDILRLQSNQIGVSTNLTTTIGQDRLVFYDHSAGKLTALGLGTGLSVSGTTLSATGITSLAADTTPQLGGDLDVNGNKIISASNGDIVLDPNGTGKIILKSDDVRMEGEDSSIQVGTIKLYEADLGGDHFVSLQAPLSLNADLAFTLPAADGTSGQVLSTNGSGALSFTDVVSTQNPAMTGTASFKQVATLPGAVKIFDADNSHGVRLLAPTSLTADLDLTLPATDGSAGQFLKTDGNGNLSFASASGSGGGDGNHYLGQFGGLFTWGSADDGERVGLHSTYGPYYFSHSTEPDQTALKDYDASQAIDSATSTMDNYKMMIMGFRVHTTNKKVKCIYSFRLQSAPSSSTWGISLWGGALDTSGSTNSDRTVTLRGKSSDITVSSTHSTAVYHGEFTTTSNINAGSIVPFLENRSGSLTTNTRLYGTFKLYLVD